MCAIGAACQANLGNIVSKPSGHQTEWFVLIFINECTSNNEWGQSQRHYQFVFGRAFATGESNLLGTTRLERDWKANPELSSYPQAFEKRGFIKSEDF